MNERGKKERKKKDEEQKVFVELILAVDVNWQYLDM